MNSKIKILFGILVIIVIGIISWRVFVWTPMNTGSCKTDSDCDFTCGCGCIPKNKTCPSNMLCKPTVCGAACYCLNGKCKSWGDVAQEAFKTKNIDLCQEIKNATCRNFCLESLNKKETSIYPDDFISKSDEIPSGFQLKVLSKESMELISLTGNPGFFNNDSYRGLFTGADSSKIEKFHASFYIKPESPLTELGIYVIKYKSKEDCDFELAKLKVEPREDSSYLRNEDILVMIWSDGGDYQKEVREITNKLKVRLNLETVVASTEVKSCMEEFPVMDFKSCIPGKVVDGWTEKVLYPNTLDTSDVDNEKRIDSPIPEKVKDAAIALYNSSMSNCKNSWFIKESGKWKEVSQIEFCEYAVDYLYSCNKCLLEWEGGCC